MFQLPYQRVLWDLIFSREENELATKECQKKDWKKGRKKKKFPQWKFPPEKNNNKNLHNNRLPKMHEKEKWTNSTNLNIIKV